MEETETLLSLSLKLSEGSLRFDHFVNGILNAGTRQVVGFLLIHHITGRIDLGANRS